MTFLSIIRKNVVISQKNNKYFLKARTPASSHRSYVFMTHADRVPPHLGNLRFLDPEDGLFQFGISKVKTSETLQFQQNAMLAPQTVKGPFRANHPVCCLHSVGTWNLPRSSQSRSPDLRCLSAAKAEAAAFLTSPERLPLAKALICYFSLASLLSIFPSELKKLKLK